VKFVNLLIDRGADPNARAGDGSAPYVGLNPIIIEKL